MSKVFLNIIIIDWDDTLFPTTWVNNNKIDMTNINSLNKYKLFFIELDNNIYELLKNLDKSGDVYIVSNANINWIKSCLSVLNRTTDYIMSNNIRILSSRDMYSDKLKDNIEWKVATFQDIISDILYKLSSKIEPNSFLNIISIGDTTFEYQALISLDSFFKNNLINIKYLLKNIRFIEKPDFDILIDQVQSTSKNIGPILNKLEFVDLSFEQ